MGGGTFQSLQTLCIKLNIPCVNHASFDKSALHFGNTEWKYLLKYLKKML